MRCTCCTSPSTPRATGAPRFVPVLLAAAALAALAAWSSFSRGASAHAAQPGDHAGHAPAAAVAYACPMKCEGAKTMLLFTFTSVPALAQHDQHKPNEPKHHDEPRATAKAAQRVGDPYAIDTCPITGKKLGSLSDPVVKLYVGREVRFCCSACPEKFGGWPAHEFGTLGGMLVALNEHAL